MSEVVSKQSIHCVGPQRKGYGEFLQRINAAGRRLSLVKVRDDFGAVDEPLQLWPDVLCIGVKTVWDGGPFNPQEAANNIIAAHNQKPVIHYWEYLNEINGLYSEQADFYIALMPLLKAAGLGLVMFSCASGTPPIPGESAPFVSRVRAAVNEARLAVITKSLSARVKRQFSATAETPYQAIARACKYAKDNGFDVLLAVHEYNYPGEFGRFKDLADYLEAQGALIPIVVTEAGYETFQGVDPFMAMVRATDPTYMADKRVIGVAQWTLGGGGWQGSNFETALEPFGEYIATVTPIEPPPPVWYHFARWIMDGVIVTDNPLKFDMPDHDVTLVGVWEKDDAPPIYRTLNIKTEPSGFEARIMQTPAGSQIAVGTAVKIEAV